MTTPIFPAGLPGVGRVLLRTNTGVIADEGDGVMSFRRRFAVPSAEVSVEWIFVADDFSVFLQFCNEVLLGFHRWFWLKLPSAGGVTWHVVRFAQGEKPTAQMNGHGAWTVSARLDIRERAFDAQPEPPTDPGPPEGEPDVLTLYFKNGAGDFGSNFLSGFDFNDQNAKITAAAYADYDAETGTVTISQLGVYEVNFSVGMGSGNFGSDRTEVGTFLGDYSNFSHTKSNSLSRHQTLTDDGGGVGIYTTDFVDSHVIIVNGSLPATFKPQLFATKYGGGGSYQADMTVVVRRLGDVFA